jgi:hypothetical protein
MAADWELIMAGTRRGLAWFSHDRHATLAFVQAGAV